MTADDHLEQFARFWSKVDASGDCWEWTGGKKPPGYGTFFPTRTKPVRAHRYAWELLIGPIPHGMTIDHRCKNPRCVNPDHLRVVSHRANILAGHGPAAMNARRTLCRKGHPLSGANLEDKYGWRTCRTCRRQSCDAYNARRRKGAIAA